MYQFRPHWRFGLRYDRLSQGNVNLASVAGGTLSAGDFPILAPYSPTLAGCFRRAGTMEKANDNVRKAVFERVELLLIKGEPIFQCERLIHVEELSIAIPRASGALPRAAKARP